MGRVPKELEGSQIYLLDSCSYFRLAKDIQPLLSVKHNHPTIGDFGLLVHELMVDEYKKSNSLANKYPWVLNPEFASQLKQDIKLSGAEKKQIADTTEFVRQFAFDNRETIKGVGEIDIMCISVALVLELILVTDDTGVSQICNEYDVSCCSSIQVLGLLCECGRTDIDHVRTIIDYWKYNKDMPGKIAAVQRQFHSIFGEDL